MLNKVNAIDVLDNQKSSIEIMADQEKIRKPSGLDSGSEKKSVKKVTKRDQADIKKSKKRGGKQGKKNKGKDGKDDE